ncbi:hypothetical protein IC006_0404 [Sulfuracidifex tepidarius]|uniref:Uncharacterized protein n=1 Tax=Sulfuracidifex tepidarius TaxID=1294262 RepID=A0A510DSM6_9CREN|nr:archaellin/type IV pilin N-terminal domain-containing protein [Sulfuracidifex tepidarius]BBG23120.1 hypothetical protein IC006_0404 [Sulfuracidifex tepidarius]
MNARKSRKGVSEVVGAVLLILITLIAMVYLVETYLRQSGFADQGFAEEAHYQELKAGQMVDTVYYANHKVTQGYLDCFIIVNVGDNIVLSKHGVLSQDSGTPCPYYVEVSNSSGNTLLGSNSSITLTHGMTYKIMVLSKTELSSIYLNASGENIIEVSS